MNETISILQTYKKQCSDSQSQVLATVLRVQGSSYRQPGARMLITTKGEIAGSVSGGCLERDLIQQARLVNHTQSRFEIIRYDTTDDGEEFESLRSVSLGCQGIVDIGLESIGPGATHPVLEILRESVEQGREGCIATIISTPENFGLKSSELADILGKVFILDSEDLNGISKYALADDSELESRIKRDLKELQTTQVKSYETPVGNIDVLLERIRPPKRWIIFGAGHDSIPLAETAQAIGWHVTVVDCRSSYSMPQRFFSKVDKLIRCEPSEISNKLVLTSDTFCVLATHNYYHDRVILEKLLNSPVDYIGILGPKKKSLSLLDDLKKEGIELDESKLSRIYSPVGIDTGAESPQEIALSIITEAMAVAKKRTAGFLRDRDGPIHDRGCSN
ncbi:MAG: XdhC family protein [Bdellovibrionia bacterium]